MRYASLRRLEKDIAAFDTGALVQRWRYARKLLEDDKATTPNGHLRHGVQVTLLEGAKKDGCKLAERELQRRLQLGRTYPTAAHIRQAQAEFGSYHALIEANFPPVEVSADAGEPDLGFQIPEERAHDAARRLLAQAGSEPNLFPPARFDDFSSLSELAKYATEMAEVTERFRQRDEERAAYLKRLVDAVNGDMSATWEEAQAALDGGA